eukprot:SM000133S26790  [mRNA]  locus=s133:117854:124683:+ [translate_table: standard]
MEASATMAADGEPAPWWRVEHELLLTSLSAARGSSACSTADAASADELAQAAEAVVARIQAGQLAEALSCRSAIRFLLDAEAGAEAAASSPACYFELILASAGAAAADGGWRGVLALALGAAALGVFVQANVTGPQVAAPVPPPVAFGHLPAGDGSSDAAVSDDPWDSWARGQLMIDGADLIGKPAVLQHLVLARNLLVLPPGSAPGLATAPWWAARALAVHQRSLAERSPTLHVQLELALSQAVFNCGSWMLLLSKRESHMVEAKPTSWTVSERQARVVAAAVRLEAGLAKEAYGLSDAARLCFHEAAEECGLSVSLSGVLGYRTKHQADPTAQMVLQALIKDGKELDLSDSEPELAGADDDDSGRLTDGVGRREHERGDDVKASAQAVDEGERDILLAPLLVDEDKSKVQSSGRASLNSIEQAIVLALSLDVRRNNPNDELRGWQMAPYIEAVSAQGHLRPMVRASCELLRIRWERSRSRTRQRALSTMERLVTDMQDGNARVAERMRYAFCVWFPTWAALQKEYGEFLLSVGLVGEAQLLFEKLELWDNLIECYRLLGKRPAAIQLVQERLKAQPDDPRLWCSLGDLTFDDDCYNKAWEVSGQRYARAHRSLARSATGRGDFRKAVSHWETALALNTLHPDGWFSLGYAAIQVEDADKALNAFTRSIQLDPDNGETWNNVAALNIHKKRSKEAFKALQEALKYKHDSWQMWDNFVRVALDVKSFEQALNGMDKILELTNNKQLDMAALEHLIREIERHHTPATPDSTPAEADACSANSEEEEESMAVGMQAHAESVARECESQEHEPEQTVGVEKDRGQSKEKCPPLFQRQLQKLLEKVAAGGAGGNQIWSLQGRFFEAVGQHARATECFQKQIRALQGSNWQKSKDTFEAFATASLQLCCSYLRSAEQNMLESPKAGARELSAARMHLRNVLKQGGDFAELDVYKHLADCLQRVQLMELSGGQEA